MLEKTDLIRVLEESLGVFSGPLPKPNQPSWLLANFGPKRSSLATATFLKGERMKINRFTALTTQMLQFLGVADEKLTTYNARRLMPSLADLLDFPPADRAKIGGWMTAEQRSTFQDLRMPNNYSHFSLDVEMCIRARAVFQVREALNRFQKAGTKGSQLKLLTWPDIATKAPTVAEATIVVNRWKEQSLVQALEQLKPEKEVQKEQNDKSSSDEDSSDSDSGSSSSSSSMPSQPSKEESEVKRAPPGKATAKAPASHSGQGGSTGSTEASHSGASSWADALGGYGSPAIPWDPQFGPMDSACESILAAWNEWKLPLKDLNMEKDGLAIIKVVQPWGNILKVYKNKIAVVTFSTKDIDDYGLSGRTVRYHSTPLATISKVFKQGKSRIAAGFSTTGSKVGVYAAETPYGSQSYAFTDDSGLSCTLAMAAGTEMGKLSSGDNRCAVYAHEHVVPAAFIFAPQGKPAGTWDVGLLHPAHKAHETYEWPTWYCNYVKQAFRLNSEWRVMAPGTEPTVKEDLVKSGRWRNQPAPVPASVPALEGWDKIAEMQLPKQAEKPAKAMAADVPSANVPRPVRQLTFKLGDQWALAPDWQWVRPATGALLHLVSEAETDILVTLCNLNLTSKSTVGEGAKAAGETGRKLCSTCWKRASLSFREMVSEQWPTLEPEEITGS